MNEATIGRIANIYLLPDSILKTLSDITFILRLEFH